MIDKVKRLLVGQRCKGYEELRRVLDEDKKSGKSKILQMKEWERFLRYKKDGKEFIIEEIYSEPKPKIDKRKAGNSNNNIYGDIVQKLILKLLAKGNHEVDTALNYYLRCLNMVNVNFINYEDNIPALASYLEIDKYYLYEFYFLMRRNLRDIFETALKGLENKGYIKSEKIPMVCAVPKEELQVDSPLTGQKSSHKKDRDYRPVTKEEEKLIDVFEKALLVDMGYKDKQQVVFAGAMPNFKKQLEKLLLEKMGIYYEYYNYRIALTNVDASEETSSHSDIGLSHLLNDMLLKNIIQNAQKRHGQLIEKYSSVWGEITYSNNKDRYRHSENYVSSYEKIVNILISDS